MKFSEAKRLSQRQPQVVLRNNNEALKPNYDPNQFKKAPIKPNNIIDLANQNQKEDSPSKRKPRERWINPLSDRTRVVPFIVPNQETQRAALGSLAGEKWRIKRSLEAILPHFQAIDKPQPGDNLYEFEEDGQNYDLFVSMSKNAAIPDLEKDVIYLCPFYCELSKAELSQLRGELERFFVPLKVKIHRYNAKQIGLEQFDPLLSPWGEPYYDAAKMNQFFRRDRPKHVYSLAVVTNLLLYNGTNVDGLANASLSVEPHIPWIFGLGSIRNHTNITSFEEILKHGYGQKKQQHSNELRRNSQQGISPRQGFPSSDMEFLKKVIKHEICHTFGMKHCIYHQCLMNGSNHYDEAVKKDGHLCPICTRKIQYVLGFDMAERYEGMGDRKSLELAQSIRDNLGCKQ